ncbi:MAG: hypothetical protein R2854_16830 [Caldilineaceae bacterium]
MKVRAGWEQLVVAGGVESMSRVPMGRDGGALMDDPVVSDAIGFVPQGISADLIATLEGFSRAELDAYAVRSQQRAARAHAEGRFRALVPVVDAAGAVLLDHDEHMRPQTTLEALAALPPAFVGRPASTQCAAGATPGGRHQPRTHRREFLGHRRRGRAGARGQRGRGCGVGTAAARHSAAALVGAEPTIMLTGPAPATQSAHPGRPGRGRLDVIECNEAFAAVVLKFMRDMGLESATASTSTAGRLRWVIRWGRRGPCSWPPHWTSWSAATGKLRWSRSAPAAAWGSPPSSNGCRKCRIED